MKYLKTFEKIGSIDPPLNIGMDLFEGMEGSLIGKEYFDKLPNIIKLFNDFDIEYRLLYNNKNFLILLPRKSDFHKLPYSKKSNKYRDYFIPYTNNFIGTFYQDVIDEDNWQEITVKTKEDFDDIESIIASIKYNL